jgi:type II secretion system protein N
MKTSHKIMLWLGFILYGMVLFALLTLYRMPADKLLSKALETVSQGKVSVSPQRTSFTPWRGYRFEDLTWTVQSGGAAVSDRMESLVLSPGFLGLLKGSLPVDMEGVVAKGTFQLSAGVSMLRGLSKGYANLKATGIQLGDLATVNQIAQRQIKGRLTGQVDLYGPLNELKKLNGQANLLVEEGAVDARVDAFGFRTIAFEKLLLPLTVKNGVASLKGGLMVGPVLAGEFEGQVRLLQNLQDSPLQVTATLRPGPSLRHDKGGDLPAKGDKPFVIQLGGTIGKPLFTLAGG